VCLNVCRAVRSIWSQLHIFFYYGLWHHIKVVRRGGKNGSSIVPCCPVSALLQTMISLSEKCYGKDCLIHARIFCAWNAKDSFSYRAFHYFSWNAVCNICLGDFSFVELDHILHCNKYPCLIYLVLSTDNKVNKIKSFSLRAQWTEICHVDVKCCHR